MNRRTLLQYGSVSIVAFLSGCADELTEDENGATDTNETESQTDEENDTENTTPEDRSVIQIAFESEIQIPFMDGTDYMINYEETMQSRNFEQGEDYITKSKSELQTVSSALGERREELESELTEEQHNDLLRSFTYFQDSINYAMKANEERLDNNPSEYNNLLAQTRQAAVTAQTLFPEDPFQ